MFVCVAGDLMLLELIVVRVCCIVCCCMGVRCELVLCMRGEGADGFCSVGLVCL